MESFLSAVHHFTVVRISRVASHPIDAAVLAWLPVIGILSALLGISFYIPLATLYLPLDVAVVPGLVAICWLRGFKPEIDFCQLCDLLFGYRKHFTRTSDLERTWSCVSPFWNPAQVRHPSAILPFRIRSTPYLRNDRQFHRSSSSTDQGTSLAVDPGLRMAHRKRSGGIQRRFEELNEPRLSPGHPWTRTFIRFGLSRRKIDLFDR